MDYGRVSEPGPPGPSGRLEDRIDAEIREAGRAVDGDRPEVEGFVAGGKRLRGALVVAVAGPVEAAGLEKVVRYAALVELLHAGGLCHDDMVDRSPQRRGATSLAFATGRAGATFTGLHLMLHAWALIADAPSEVRCAVARAADDVATGQADEMADLYRSDLRPSAYIERCRLKTGALFELAAELGGVAAGMGPEVRESLRVWGSEFGVAYQLVDDVGDLRGKAVPGRMPGIDLREGVYTLPVLLTMEDQRRGSREIRTLLRRLRHSPEPAPLVAEIRARLVANGAVDDTRAWAERHVARAWECIAHVRIDVRDRLRRVVSMIPGMSGAPNDGSSH